MKQNKNGAGLPLNFSPTYIKMESTKEIDLTKEVGEFFYCLTSF